jgi:hypothetical protein
MQWIAVYTDGTQLQQHDGKVENRYADIDRRRLAAFSLVEGSRVVCVVHFDHPAQRLIYRRRVFVKPGGGEDVYYLAGWQRLVGGQNVQSIAVVHGDGERVDVIGKWRENHWLFDAVELREEEEERDALAQ